MRQQLTGLHVTEYNSDREQSRPPALRVEVMLDMLAVIVRLLMLANQTGRQRPTAPLAAMRLSVHSGKSAMKVSIAHVMPLRQTAIGQRLPVVEIVAKTRTSAFHDLEQLAVRSRADVGTHLWQWQSRQSFLGFDSIITHRFFELKVQVDGSKAV